ncbi:hypothetical protein HFD88_010556 [Aspergillus terreus]|nr:hypothetical protein HFD88_010556 [Aspergillus terreus]
MSSSAIPGGAPPPPPPPLIAKNTASSSAPTPPEVHPNVPPGGFLVELLIYNGAPFKDHWAYFIHPSKRSELGVLMEAAGDVRNGFKIEIDRSHDLAANPPTKRIPLQWVGHELFGDDNPKPGFEASACKVEAPGKTLNAVDDIAAPTGRKVKLRNCQTWIVESADQLVEDGIFRPEVAGYLHAIEQL